jgi:hypothetical protein
VVLLPDERILEREPRPVGLPCFVATGRISREVAGTVHMRSSPLIHPGLRGRSLSDRRAGGVEGLSAQGGAVLASSAGNVLWTTCEAIHRAALTPDELEPTDSLRDALVPGRWLALLPLVHFLREVTSEIDWSRPPTRATFIIDDPNLHWWSYGFVDFRQFADDADDNGYHVAVATIPLDAWLVHPGVARLFRDRWEVLSLLLHGNDHTREELNQPRTDEEAARLLAQALHRIETLERHSRLRLSRLMVAPHGLCSEQMMHAMMLSGFEGLCYAWASPRSSDQPLTGWGPADLRAGGFPVFPRVPLSNSLDDLVLRSFLGQPLIVYAHHHDFIDGPDLLVETAAFINREPAVRWASTEGLARLSYLTRRDGALLRVQPFARRIHLDVDEDVEHIVVELPRSHSEPDWERVTLAIGGANSSSPLIGGQSNPLAVRGAGTVRVSLERIDAVDPRRIASASRRVRPLVRRAATEGRDRLLPVSARLRGTLRGRVPGAA